MFTLRPNALLVLLLSLVTVLTGCQQEQRSDVLTASSFSYQQGDFAATYRTTEPLTRSGNEADRNMAAYLAGLSAMQMGQLATAERHLQQAARSRDESLATDAKASLGLVHFRMSRYSQAARELTAAAPKLSGDQRANAHYYAGLALQRLGQWAQARTQLVLARSATEDALLRSQINQQLDVTGFTVQIGAFSTYMNAQRVAEQVAPQAVNLRLGAPRLVPASDRQGRKLTLVQVGRFSSYHTALDARNRLGRQGAIIVPMQN